MNVKNTSEIVLYESAKQLFYQHGYHGASVRDIVTNANSKLGLFTYYYESKDALAIAIFRDYVQAVTKALHARLPEAFDLEDMLLLDMMEYRGYFMGLTASPQIARFYRELTTTPSYLQQNYQFKQFFFNRVLNGMPRGKINRDLRQPDAYQVSASLAAGMEIQLCRDLCGKQLGISLHDAVDLYFKLYYALLVSDKKLTLHYIQESRRRLDGVSLETGESFQVLARMTDSRTQETDSGPLETEAE